MLGSVPLDDVNEIFFSWIGLPILHLAVSALNFKKSRYTIFELSTRSENSSSTYKVRLSATFHFFLTLPTLF